MGYRRFKLPEIGLTSATVATLATVRNETGPSVANVARVASPELASEAPGLRSVATVATVAEVESETRVSGLPDLGVVPAAYRAAFGPVRRMPGRRSKVPMGTGPRRPRAV